MPFVVWLRGSAFVPICGGGHGAQEDILETATQILRHDLGNWYKRRHQQYPQEKLTRLHVTRKKIGDENGGKFGAKAAECYGYCIYLMDKLRPHARRLGATAVRYYEAGQALLDMLSLFSACGAVMHRAEQQRAFDLFQRYSALTDNVAGLLLPKRHMVLHLLRGIQWFGNPRAYANWVDETLNRMLKSACRTTSQQTFEPSVTLRMAVMLRGGQGSKRKRV